MGKRNCVAEITSHSKMKLWCMRPNFISICETMQPNFQGHGGNCVAVFSKIEVI